jgi:hypothetical protein
LDFLGFPWILSSESRLFNGLQPVNDRRFFQTGAGPIIPSCNAISVAFGVAGLAMQSAAYIVDASLPPVAKFPPSPDS